MLCGNTGGRHVRISSHYHFSGSSEALEFDSEAAHGRRLDIAPGTAVRFETRQRREVNLIEVSGTRRIFGFNAKVMGDL